MKQIVQTQTQRSVDTPSTDTVCLFITPMLMPSGVIRVIVLPYVKDCESEQYNHTISKQSSLAPLIYPDRSKTGKLSVTPVNANKVPMPPPNGMQPQLIVTIQPHGAVFDPPAEITLPNVDGHLPGAEIEMYSYDHDLEEFVTIGLGTVSKDGSIITSNVGSGVIKAGWTCGGGPGGSGCAHLCKYCEDCVDPCNCVKVPSRLKRTQTPNDCKTAYCGGDEADDDPKEDKPADCRDPICVGKNHDTKPADETAELEAKNGNNCQYCESGDIKNLKIDYLRVEAEGEEILDVDYDGEPVSVNFTSEARSYLGDCEIKYLWDFGDGNDSTSQNPTHSYEKPGKYVTTLKVSCEGCEQATKSGSVTVNVNPVRVDLIDVTIESKEVLKLTYEVEKDKTLKSARFDFVDDLREITNKTGTFEIIVDPRKIQENSLAIARLTYNDDKDYIPVEINMKRYVLQDYDIIFLDLLANVPVTTLIANHKSFETYKVFNVKSPLGVERLVFDIRSSVNLNTQVGSSTPDYPSKINLWNETHRFKSIRLGYHDDFPMQTGTGGFIPDVPPGQDWKYKELSSNRTYGTDEETIEGTASLDALQMGDSFSPEPVFTDLVFSKEIKIQFKLSD